MFKNFPFSRVFLKWLPLAITITLLCGLIYFVTQQNYRVTANDPQIQIAEDTAEMLKTGNLNLDQSLPANVDIAKSLATYIVIYDSNYNVISSTGSLNGHQPVPPSGVFEYAKANVRNTLTWQPMTGVRSAIVVVYYNNGTDSGFVLVGRSLKEVETRENTLILEVVAGWLFTICASFVTIIGVSAFYKKYSSTNH